MIKMKKKKIKWYLKNLWIRIKIIKTNKYPNYNSWVIKRKNEMIKPKIIIMKMLILIINNENIDNQLYNDEEKENEEKGNDNKEKYKKK